MSGRKFPLSVSEFTTWPWTFERDVEAYARHGIDALEVTEFKLAAARVAEQLALVETHGLTVSSVQAAIQGLFPTKLQPEPVAPADRLRHLRASIERIAPHVPAGTPFVAITGAPPGGDIAFVVDTAVREFTGLARFAHTHNVRIALESFGLCVDAWNIWQSRDLLRTIGRAGKRIFLVQLSDWGPPRGFYDRLVPGAGSERAAR